MYFLRELLILLFLGVTTESRSSSKVVSRLPRLQLLPWLSVLRGGSFFHKGNTVQDYVSNVQERDAQDDEDPRNNKKSAAVSETPDDENSSPPQTAAEESSAVGVKSHKKSNAVGDPDGEGSDDSSDDDTEDWEEIEESIQLLDPSSTLQVEVELVEETDEDGASINGGGVGIRMGRNRRKSKQTEWVPPSTKITHEQLWDAWKAFCFLPPGSAGISFLKERARLIDGASKSRLDRRTLYGALLLEWLQANASYRKFLDAQTSQALQSALSLATQPQWRKAFPRNNAIRLYDEEPFRGCTLAMQETIAMALVSLNEGLS